MNHSQLVVGLAVAAGALIASQPSRATPPEYATYQRPQALNPAIDARDVLRIWCVYVGQGDGLLIQLPPRLAYDPDDSGPRASDERQDIVVDAGSFESSLTGEMADFIQRLYPQSPAVIEHAVLSHHDLDHVAGLTTLLHEPGIAVGHVYHNGLASFAPGARGLPATGKPGPGVIHEYDTQNGRIKRALGKLRQDGSAFLAQYVMDDLAELRTSLQGGQLQGIYRDFAAAIVDAPGGGAVRGFHRAIAGQPFIEETAARDGHDFGDVRIELLWPGPQLRPYGDWGKTINGNSVTFRLVYRDFEMLFTGDHNEQSETALLQDFTTTGTLESLRADVLKVPHHGSKHGVQDFFEAVAPVLGVASQGPQGARSKAMGNANAWEHPSPEVIGWLGGAHRAYLTHLHERRFDWVDIDTQPELEDLEEATHILIETDGHWFRVVEVDRDWPALDTPPTIAQTPRSDGTRWISAR